MALIPLHNTWLNLLKVWIGFWVSLDLRCTEQTSEYQEKAFIPKDMTRYTIIDDEVLNVDLGKSPLSRILLMRSCSGIDLVFETGSSEQIELGIKERQLKVKYSGNEKIENSDTDLLRCDQITSFWITWHNSTFTLGKGVILDKDILTVTGVKDIKQPSLTVSSSDGNTIHLLIIKEDKPKKNICTNDAADKPLGVPWVYYPAGQSCYHIYDNLLTWQEAEVACTSNGGHLTSVSSWEELIFLAGLFANRQRSLNVYIGRVLEAGNKTEMPEFWTDGLPFIFMPSAQVIPSGGRSSKMCMTLRMDYAYYPKFGLSNCEARYKFICKKRQSRRGKSRGKRPKCPPELFTCNDGSCIHLSNRCDRKAQCKDGSDEYKCGIWCPWWQYQCRNKQCVAASAFCNGTYECRDRSDETQCHHPDNTNRVDQDGSSRTAVVKFSVVLNIGNTALTSVAPKVTETNISSLSAVKHRCLNGQDTTGDSVCRLSENSYSSGCPDFSHLIGCDKHRCMKDETKCPSSYCIPNEHVCDGRKHCSNGEDEMCKDITCFDQYICKDTGLCISKNAVCDGQNDCPLRDDEHHCAHECPRGCTCFDQVVNCTERETITTDGYNRRKFPDLSNQTTVVDISYNSYFSISRLATWLDKYPYLFYLNISGNDFSGLSSSVFKKSKNIRVLDISNSDIKKLYPMMFDNMKRLKILRMTDNHIKRIQARHLAELKELQLLDVSNNSLKELKNDLFKKSKRLLELYLANNQISEITAETFKELERLIVLDLSDNPIKEVEMHSFSNLEQLQVFLMPKPDLCCMTDVSEARKSCKSQFPVNETTECFTLIKIQELRIPMCILFVWIVMGNFMMIFQKCRGVCNKSEAPKFARDFPTISLCLCYFYQGVYVLMILEADKNYGETFQTFRRIWRESYECKIAGCLLLLSLQVSNLMIVLLLWNGVVLMGNAGSRLKSTRRCMVTFVVLFWIVCIGGYLMPVLPLSDFKETYYEMSDFCAPILHKIDLDNIWAEPFVLATYGIEALCLVLILLGVIVLLCQNNATGGRMGKQPGIDSITAFEKKLLAVVFFGTARCGTLLTLGGLSSFTDVEVPADIDIYVILIVIPSVAAACPLVYLLFLCMTKKPVDKDSYLENIYALAGNGAALQQGVSNTILASAGLGSSSWMAPPSGPPPSYCSSVSAQPPLQMRAAQGRSGSRSNLPSVPLSPIEGQAVLGPNGWMYRGGIYDSIPTAPNESLYNEPFDDDRIYSSLPRQDTIHPPSSAT